MMIVSLIVVIVGLVLLFYGSYLNNDTESVLESLLTSGKTDPGESFLFMGILVLAVGVVLLFFAILKDKKQPWKLTLLSSLDLIIPVVIIFIGTLSLLYGHHLNNDLGTAIESFLSSGEPLSGQGFVNFGIITLFIGGFTLFIEILRRFIPTEAILSVFIGLLSLRVLAFLFLDPLYGLQAPGTAKVVFNIQFLHFMSNSDGDMSSVVNVFCSFLFILTAISLIATILSQFMYMPKVNLISSFSNVGILILMLLGLMAIYSLYNRDSFSISRSISVYAEYGYCLGNSILIAILSIIKVHTVEYAN